MALGLTAQMSSDSVAGQAVLYPKLVLNMESKGPVFFSYPYFNMVNCLAFMFPWDQKIILRHLSNFLTKPVADLS